MGLSSHLYLMEGNCGRCDDVEAATTVTLYVIRTRWYPFRVFLRGTDVLPFNRPLPTVALETIEDSTDRLGASMAAVMRPHGPLSTDDHSPIDNACLGWNDLRLVSAKQLPVITPKGGVTE
jgi:hypothetical protein